MMLETSYGIREMSKQRWWENREDAVATGSLVAFVLLARRPEGDLVLVEVDGRPIGRFSLRRERMVNASGPLGVTEIQIEDGGVEVVRSPCVQQFCVRTGRIARKGQIIACVPNRVVVRIPGGDGADGVDAVTR